MSKTRNQRQRSRERLALLLMSLLLAISLALLAWSLISLERELHREPVQAPVIPAIYTETYLPEDFDEGAYRAACQSYAVEEGLTLHHHPTAGGGN